MSSQIKKTVYFDDDLYREIKAYAKLEKISFSAAVIKLLSQSLWEGHSQEGYRNILRTELSGLYRALEDLFSSGLDDQKELLERNAGVACSTLLAIHQQSSSQLDEDVTKSIIAGNYFANGFDATSAIRRSDQIVNDPDFLL